MIKRIALALVASLAVAACQFPDNRPAQRAECDSFGGQYREDPEGFSEDTCLIPTENGKTFEVEYDDVHQAPGATGVAAD